MNKNPQVIIVGAGIAGLAAAQPLAERGIHAVILEAQTRAGGRISTDRSLGIPLERGASWFHGLDGNPVADIAKQLALQFQPSEFAMIYFASHSQPHYSSEMINEFRHESFANLLAIIATAVKKNGRDISLAQALNISPRTWTSFINKQCRKLNMQINVLKLLPIKQRGMQMLSSSPFP